MVDTKPVTDRIAMVRSDGRLTAYGLDILKGFELAIGGPGQVTLPSSEISGVGDNELARFTATGDLENTGLISIGDDLAVPGDLTAGGVEYPGKFARFEVTVDQAVLAGAGQVVILDAEATEQWDVLDIIISGTGTNFSGGDRLLDVKQSGTVFTTITTTLLQALATTRWGGTGVPLPAAPETPTAAGQDIVASYSGGLTDYTAGSCTLILTAAKI